MHFRIQVQNYTCIHTHDPQIHQHPTSKVLKLYRDSRMCVFLTFVQYNQRSSPSNWGLYQLKAGVGSGVIHLTWKETWAPAIQTHRRHQLPPSLLFSPRFPCFIKDLPLVSPLTLHSPFLAHSPSFIHSFSSPLQLTTSHRPLLHVQSPAAHQRNQLLRYLNDYQ